MARHLIVARLHDVDADEAWNDRMDEFYEGCLALTTSLRREGVLAREWTAPAAADYLWAGASVQVWALVAVERATGEAKAVRLLRTGLRASLLAAHE